MGSSPFDRLYSGNRYYFLLLRVLRCFSSPRLPRAQGAVTGSLPPGCPIRISAASAGICPSPRLFAAYHVLHRLREPRHPPCALLDSVFSFPFRSLEKPCCASPFTRTASVRGLDSLLRGRRPTPPSGARCDLFSSLCFCVLSALPYPILAPISAGVRLTDSILVIVLVSCVRPKKRELLRGLTSG